MIKIGCTFLFLAVLACGSNGTKKNKNIIGGEPSQEVIMPQEKPVEKPVEKPSIPEGAVTANFKSKSLPFYGYISKVDTKNGITEISFQNNATGKISIPKTYGATLSKLRFAEFDKDLLLVTAKLKDPNFNKYYLYTLTNGKWLPVVNGFAIHKNNAPDTLQPIVVDPENPNKVLRYYSVFDLSDDKTQQYTWRLLQESIPIENR